MVSAPEVAGEENDDREELQSADDHEGAKIELQRRVVEGEVAHGCSVAEGCPGV